MKTLASVRELKVRMGRSIIGQKQVIDRLAIAPAEPIRIEPAELVV